jgi:hypothetical protein
MSYTAKTDWTAADGVAASDLNRIEQGVADANDPTKLLTNIKTVDGTGSGLDADTVRGKVVIAADGTVPMTGLLQTPVILTKNAASLQYVHQAFEHNGVQRWKIATEPTADLAIYDYDASGGTPRQTAAFNKSTGQLNVTGGYSWNGTYMAQTRLNGTKLEYWNGTGWQSIMSYGSGQYHGGTFTTATTDQTVLSVTGMGKLNYLKLLGSFGIGYVTVIVDGVTISNSLSFNTTSSNPANTPGYYIPVGSNGQAVSTIYPASIGPIKADVSFESSLVIKLRVDTSSNMGLDWQYEVV